MKIIDYLKKWMTKETDGAYPEGPKPKIDFIESMKVLEFKRGDVIVMTTSGPIPTDVRDYLRGAVKEVFHVEERGVKVVILEDGMDIGIMRGEP